MHRNRVDTIKPLDTCWQTNRPNDNPNPVNHDQYRKQQRTQLHRVPQHSSSTSIEFFCNDLLVKNLT